MLFISTANQQQQQQQLKKIRYDEWKKEYGTRVSEREESERQWGESQKSVVVVWMHRMQYPLHTQVILNTRLFKKAHGHPLRRFLQWKSEHRTKCSTYFLSSSSSFFVVPPVWAIEWTKERRTKSLNILNWWYKHRRVHTLCTETDTNAFEPHGTYKMQRQSS